MYALIVSEEYGGEPMLLATARTLPAIQRKWLKLLDGVNHPYACVGILTSKGLINFFGQKIDGQKYGHIAVSMGVYRDRAEA